MIPPVEKRVLNYALNKTPINTWNWVRWSEPGCSGSGRKYCRSCSSQSRGAAKRWLTTGGPVQENKLYAAFFFLRALFRLTRSEGEGLKHVKKKRKIRRDWVSTRCRLPYCLSLSNKMKLGNSSRTSASCHISINLSGQPPFHIRASDIRFREALNQWPRTHPVNEFKATEDFLVSLSQNCRLVSWFFFCLGYVGLFNDTAWNAKKEKGKTQCVSRVWEVLKSEHFLFVVPLRHYLYC